MFAVVAGWHAVVALLFSLLVSLLVSLPMAAGAQPMDSTAAPAKVPAVAPAPATLAPANPDDPSATGNVVLHNRRIVQFRAPLLGDTPAERAEMALAGLQTAVARKGPGVVTRSIAGDAVRFAIDGETVFFLLADDLSGPRPALALAKASQDVQRRLETALQEARELTDPRALAIGAAWSVGATVLAWLVVRALLVLRRKAVVALYSRVLGGQGDTTAGQIVSTYADHARVGVRAVATVLTWLMGLLVFDAWVTFVLRQFAYTRPWGERSTAWLLGVAEQFALGIASAVPGLLIAVLIFLLARLVSRANTLFLERVERGEVRIAWLDADIAGPTRRLANLGIWLFALAMAYPYLPGSGSEAFKGVSVLAGVMLSLGASSVVGQALSGLSLMYSRSLRPGEYVKIGEVEGTVLLVGIFATKIHTGMGEEVSIPNTVTFSQPVRNYSRLVDQDGQFMLHTTVTIGYATPWRQVHAMLLEAARRTQGIAEQPPPYVMQTALSDFYVEYRLCAQGTKLAPRRRAQAITELHGNVQDVFNEQGVQIMSPHYRSDPPEPQVVPPGPWTGQAPGAEPVVPPAAAARVPPGPFNNGGART
jgi:small-conductance mechanosensitive channel